MVSVIVETTLVLCTCADGPQRLGLHVAEPALGKGDKVRPARSAALTERRRVVRGQIALDQPIVVDGSGRGRLGATRATRGGAFGGDVEDAHAWIVLRPETEGWGVVAETLRTLVSRLEGLGG
ncbi:MAG: hypothetical protein Q9195_005599 [Heterodermia aff. obscurata]